jgi:hypothetical protein
MLVLTAASIPATGVLAKPKATTPQPNLCASFDVGSNYWDFAVPGEIRVGPNGHKYICGEDGQWHQVADFGPANPAPLQPIAPVSNSTLGS